MNYAAPGKTKAAESLWAQTVQLKTPQPPQLGKTEARDKTLPSDFSRLGLALVQ